MKIELRRAALTYQAPDGEVAARRSSIFMASPPLFAPERYAPMYAAPVHGVQSKAARPRRFPKRILTVFRQSENAHITFVMCAFFILPPCTRARARRTAAARASGRCAAADTGTRNRA